MHKDLEFISYRVIGIPFFKDQEFKLNTPGLHVVVGHNANNGGSLNPNAVGKSLFFSSLLEFIIQVPVHGVKGDMIKSGTRILTFRRGKHTYVATRKASGKREVLSIERNGKPMTYKDTTSAHEELRRLIRLSDEELYTLLYFDALVPHPLVRGTNLQRRDFFKGFFRGLSSLDDIKSLMKAYEDQVKSDTLRLSVLQEQLDKLGADEDMSELKGRLDVLERRQDKLTRLYPEVVRVSQLRANISKAEQGIPAAALQKYRTEAELRSLEDKLKAKLQVLTLEYESALKLETFQDEKEEAEARVSWAKEVLGESSVTVEEADEAYQTIREEISALNADRLASKLKSYTEALEDLETKLSRDTEALEQHREAANKCPTCGGKYDNREAQSTCSKLESRIKTTKEDLRTGKVHVQEVEDSIRDAKKSKLRLEKKLEEAKTIRIAAEARDTGSRILSKYAKLSKSCSMSTKEAKAQIDKTRTRLEITSKMIHIHRLREEYSEVPDNILQHVDNIEELQTRLTKCTKEASALGATLAAYESRRKQAEGLSKDINDIGSRIGDLEAWEVLKKAFDRNKGVELIMAQHMAKSLETQINKYSALIFPETFRFSVCMEKEYSIRVTRGHGQEAQESDIRKLSGAEGRLMPLVLLMSILSFVPEADRPNMLILDEPTAHMGTLNSENFVSFLSYMLKVIPTIIVITPTSPDPYSRLDSTTWTVVKKGNSSKIVSGEVQ